MLSYPLYWFPYPIIVKLHTLKHGTAVKIHTNNHKIVLCLFYYFEYIFHSFVMIFLLAACLSKMINLSQPDTIDERVINTKKLTTFRMTVSVLAP